MKRADVIQAILDKVSGKTYLEIGICAGNNFGLINAEMKIGVDPIPPAEKIRNILTPKTLYFQMTSDAFFDNHNHLFNKHKLDVALVDGLHEYKQALKDVQNCLKYLNEGGVIILHDCNPTSEIIATPTHLLDTVANLPEWEGMWTGDVWKAIAQLRSTENNLNIFVLDCDWGIGIITKGKPEKLLKYSKEEIEQMSYKDLEKNRKQILNLKDPKYFSTFLENLG